MTQIKLYLDEDVMLNTLVSALRARGVDVLTAYEAGMIHREDADHLAFSTTVGRVLHSFNVRDYLALHSSILSNGEHHSGIILSHQQRFPIGEHLRRILRIVSAKTADEMIDTVEFLGSWG